MKKHLVALALSVATTLPIAALSDVGVGADANRRDRETIQNAERQVQKESRRAEIIELVAEAMSAKPSETGAKALEQATRWALDAAGACSSCDMERKASAAADARRTSEIIVEQSKGRK